MSIEQDIRSAASEILSHRSATIISHIDADGITSEAILSQACSRAGMEVKTVFLRQLDPLTIGEIPDDPSLKIFSDFGSGQKNLLHEHGFFQDLLIIDHHVSQPSEYEYLELNSLKWGYEKTSAAGVCYLVARGMDEVNQDLAKLAVIGNVGDMMDREDLCLSGLVREALNDGIRYGNVELWERDLNIYGISSRPLPNALAYSDDLDIPGISHDLEGAKQFLASLGLSPDDRRIWPVWHDIPLREKQLVASALIDQIIAHDKPTDRLFSDHYIFPDEDRSCPPLRNASEYATLLNSCGRWKRPELGGAICRGDRRNSYRDAEYMLRNHRAKIREVLNYIVDTGVSELSHLQYINVGDLFPDTIVGIGAGMALSHLNASKPILILCEDSLNPEQMKVSMRTKPDLISQGVDLQKALCSACVRYEGSSGGGHRIAAGAFIPRLVEQEFIEDVNRILAQQYAQTSSDTG